jgi:hypothetical protein
MYYVFVFLAILSCQNIVAQSVVATVRSNDVQAKTFINGQAFGNADGKTFVTLTSGSYQIRLVPTDSLSWTLAPIQRNLQLGRIENRDTLYIEMPFPYIYRFSSLPVGEKVYSMGIMQQRQMIGTTPLYYQSFEQSEKFWIERDGQSSDTLFTNATRFLQHQFKLGQVQNTPNPLIKAPKSRKHIKILSVITALAGGAYAANYKLKADAIYYGEYAQTGNPLLKSEVNRLDKKAWIGVAVMQTGIISLVYQLVKR